MTEEKKVDEKMERLLADEIAKLPQNVCEKHIETIKKALDAGVSHKGIAGILSKYASVKIAVAAVKAFCLKNWPPKDETTAGETGGEGETAGETGGEGETAGETGGGKRGRKAAAVAAAADGTSS